MDSQALVHSERRHPKILQILDKFRWREFLPLIGLIAMTAIFIILTEGRLIAS